MEYEKLILRPSSRVLLLDEDDRILLFKGLTSRTDIPALWVPPGGGLEDGETHEQAALRELQEETGLCDVELGPCVWTRRITFRWDEQLIDSVERYYFVRTHHFQITTSHFDDNPDSLERDSIVDIRWWRLPEIELASRHEVFVPRRLAELLAPIIAGDIPPTPFDAGM